VDIVSDAAVHWAPELVFTRNKLIVFTISHKPLCCVLKKS